MGRNLVASFVIGSTSSRAGWKPAPTTFNAISADSLSTLAFAEMTERPKKRSSNKEKAPLFQR